MIVIEIAAVILTDAAISGSETEDVADADADVVSVSVSVSVALAAVVGDAVAATTDLTGVADVTDVIDVTGAKDVKIETDFLILKKHLKISNLSVKENLRRNVVVTATEGKKEKTIVGVKTIAVLVKVIDKINTKINTILFNHIKIPGNKEPGISF